MRIKILFVLFFISPFIYAAPYPNESRVFNLVTREARLISGVTFNHDAAGFNVQDANNIWIGTGPDGNKYKVSTLKYSYQGTISLDITESFYEILGNCEIDSTRAQVFIGWTVMQPGISGVVYKENGALYDQSFASGVGVQTRWVGMSLGKPEFTVIFSQPGLSAEVYVTDGPRGIYKMPGSGRAVYVHGDGQSPNVLPYSDMYGFSCGDQAILSVGEFIPTDPIEPPTPDTVCNFWLDTNVLNLGTVDQTSAKNAYNSTKIIGQCNSDATVNMYMKPQHQDMDMGGLTVHLSFDNDYWSNTKSNWQLNENVEASSTLWAQVSKVGTLTPGEYSESGVIYIDYD